VYGIYVWLKANGDKTTALSAGFGISETVSKGTKTFTIKLGKLSGSVDMDINSYCAAA